MLNQTDKESVQNWINQIADIQSTVTSNAITEWASKVPIKNIEECDYAPLFLYGDATIDKAIVSIIRGDVFNENDAIRLATAIKNNFSFDVSNVDISINNAGSIPAIQSVDSWTEIPLIGESLDKFKEYLEKNNNLNCEVKSENSHIYLKSLDGFPAHSKILKALGNYSRKYEKKFNLKNFSRITVKDFDDKRLKDKGFEVFDYSSEQILISNDIDSYIVTKSLPNRKTDTIEVETFDGNMEYYDSIDEFISKITSNKNFSNKNFFEDHQYDDGINDGILPRLSNGKINPEYKNKTNFSNKKNSDKLREILLKKKDK